jgi:hypothetical protein
MTIPADTTRRPSFMVVRSLAVTTPHETNAPRPQFVNQLDLGKVGTKLAPNAEPEVPPWGTAFLQGTEFLEEEEWSRRSGLNRRPADYEQNPDQTIPTDSDASSTKTRGPPG